MPFSAGDGGASEAASPKRGGGPEGLPLNDGVGGDLGISSPSEESYKAARYSLCHIVQDEEACTRIHAEVLPPLEYHDRLTVILMDRFPEAAVDLVEHVVSLAAAFDTASAFAISFGINKFQLAQAWVKLFGDIVGRQDSRRA